MRVKWKRSKTLSHMCPSPDKQWPDYIVSVCASFYAIIHWYRKCYEWQNLHRGPWVASSWQLLVSYCPPQPSPEKMQKMSTDAETSFWNFFYLTHSDLTHSILTLMALVLSLYILLVYFLSKKSIFNPFNPDIHDFDCFRKLCCPHWNKSVVTDLKLRCPQWRS